MPTKTDAPAECDPARGCGCLNPCLVCNCSDHPQQRQVPPKCPSEFARNQVKTWQRQLSGRELSKQQKKLLNYFAKVQGRADYVQRNKRPPSPRSFPRKGVIR